MGGKVKDVLDLLIEGALEKHGVCQSIDEGHFLWGGEPASRIAEIHIGIFTKSNDFSFVHAFDYNWHLWDVATSFGRAGGGGLARRFIINGTWMFGQMRETLANSVRRMAKYVRNCQLS